MVKPKSDEEIRQAVSAAAPPGVEWEEVIGDSGGETIELENYGVFVGKFVGTREVLIDDPDAEGGKKTSHVHDFEEVDKLNGEMRRVGVWDSYDLGNKLKKIEPGNLVSIELMKEIPIDGGKRRMKLFRVRVAVTQKT